MFLQKGSGRPEVLKGMVGARAERAHHLASSPRFLPSCTSLPTAALSTLLFSRATGQRLKGKLRHEKSHL